MAGLVELRGRGQAQGPLPKRPATLMPVRARGGSGRLRLELRPDQGSRALAKKLAAEGNRRRYALTANEGTLLTGEVTKTWVLKCGWEQACAATKSVVEQVLFYQSIVSHVASLPSPDSGEGQGVRARDMRKAWPGWTRRSTAC